MDIIIRDVEEKDGQYKIYNKDGTGRHWYITKESAEVVSHLLEPLVSFANGGYWQKCPKCDGQGIVTKPPWIPEGQNQWSSSSEPYYTCNLCNGQMVIKQQPFVKLT